MERFSIEKILFMFKILLTLVEISLKISMENYLEFDKITLFGNIWKRYFEKEK